MYRTRFLKDGSSWVSTQLIGAKNAKEAWDRIVAETEAKRLLRPEEKHNLDNQSECFWRVE